MRKILKCLLIILIVNFTFYIVHSDAYGKDFSSFYKVTYTFDEQGTANVTQEISLINNAADLYVTQYTISILGSGIKKIEAFDKIGPLKTDVLYKEGTTLVTLNFNEKVVGKGKILSFIIKYQGDGLAEKEGNLWQISLPRLGNTNDIEEYQLSLKIPKIFGKVAYLNPNPLNQERTQDYYVFTFDKSSVEKGGILASFGPYQTFDFTLLYEIKNGGESEKFERIALPPDTSYQSMNYEYLKPPPENVEVDNDGNWLAVYRLYSKQNLVIEAKGQVNVFSSPKNKIYLNKDNLVVYTTGQKYWPIDNIQIKDLAKLYNTPEKIYDYVKNVLSYDYSAINIKSKRRGAVESLKFPDNSICTDFSDLFVAIARAARIPARELEGYAFTDNPKMKEVSENSDLLHSWPEYFDETKKEWIMIDPTFSATSGGLDFFNQIDMSHIVFSIHGISDIYPPPAGSYKEQGNLSKQVNVTLSEEEKFSGGNVVVKEVKPSKIYSLKNNFIEIVFNNNMGKAIYNNDISLNNNVDIYPKNLHFNVFPPYSFLKKQVSIKPEEVYKDYFLFLDFNVGKEKLNGELFVCSLFLRFVFAGCLLAIILLVVLLILIRKRAVSLTKGLKKC